MIYAILYCFAAFAHVRIATTIYRLYSEGYHWLAVVGALTWFQIIRIAE